MIQLPLARDVDVSVLQNCVLPPTLGWVVPAHDGRVFGKLVRVVVEGGPCSG